MNLLKLERYVAGCATPDEMVQIEGSPEAMARVAEMQRDSASILAAHPPAVVAALVRARAAYQERSTGEPHFKAERSARRPMMLGLSSAIAIACCTVLFMVVRPSDDVRAKGATHLSLYRQRNDGGIEQLKDGDVARAGDTLQVAYVAGTHDFGAIVSVDGRRGTTVHLEGTLSHHGQMALPHAYTLDNAPRFERFVFATADTPIDTRVLSRMLHETPEIGSASLSRALGGADVVVFTVRKDP